MEHPRTPRAAAAAADEMEILFCYHPKMVLHFQLIEISSQLVESNIQDGNARLRTTQFHPDDKFLSEIFRSSQLHV